MWIQPKTSGTKFVLDVKGVNDCQRAKEKERGPFFLCHVVFFARLTRFLRSYDSNASNLDGPWHNDLGKSWIFSLI